MAEQRLLLKARSKDMHSQWKQGHVAWEDCTDTVRICADGIRKAKVQM